MCVIWNYSFALVISMKMLKECGHNVKEIKVSGKHRQIYDDRFILINIA